MTAIKSLLKQAFLAVGLDVQKADRRLPTPQPPNPLVHHGIELLFDVGANVGQYAQAARAAGYRGRIVSFEPLPEAHARLAELAKSDSLLTAHERCAVGDSSGETDINVAGNSYSSSILPMLPSHTDAAPSSAYVGKVRTRVITLESVFGTYRTRNERTFLKIDTQGYEKQVLAGAAANLANVVALELELSTVPLYENQELYDYFVNLLQKKGFKLWSIAPAFVNRTTGQMLQFDAVFSR